MFSLTSATLNQKSFRSTVNHLIKKLLLSLLFVFGLSSSCLYAQQVVFPEQENTIIQSFWNELYAQGGWTLYCGYRFGPNRVSLNNRPVSLSHVYPLDKILGHLNCDSRLQCQQNDENRFREMEEDLHNIYPVDWEIVPNLSGKKFGLIEGEDWRFEDCDFERVNGTLEPRDIARGNIARAIFYMHYRYGLPIDDHTMQMLKEWNRLDSPSTQEKQRNDKIEQIQGRRNPFVDDPIQAEKIGID